MGKWSLGWRLGLLTGGVFAALLLALEVARYALPFPARFALGMMLLIAGSFGAGYLTAARHKGTQRLVRAAAWEGAKAGALLLTIPVILLLAAEHGFGLTAPEREPADRPLPQEAVPVHPPDPLWKSSAYVALVLAGAGFGAALGILGAANRAGNDYARRKP